MYEESKGALEKEPSTRVSQYLAILQRRKPQQHSSANAPLASLLIARVKREEENLDDRIHICAIALRRM